MSIINENLHHYTNPKNPRIHHFKIRGEWNLHHYVEAYLQIDIETINALLRLGAIYLNGKRIFENTQLTEGDYLRVHAQPRRFKVPADISDLILFEDDYFIALNKPQGIPCHPTLDNSFENLLNLLSLDRNQGYFLCHRLDIGTEGVLLFAKSKEIQTYMMQHWKDVKKIYQAQTHGPQLKPQLLRHWMRPHPRAPKILASKQVENWQICELNILSSKLTKISEELYFNEYEIELLTGRTHQIRAQLSFEQNPILGDTMYGSSFSNQSESDSFALKCIEISFRFFDKDYLLLKA
jgi:23S rRNA pseudouridine1911/1915/1917 synthase